MRTIFIPALVFIVLAPEALAQLAFRDVSTLSGANVKHEFLNDYGDPGSTPIRLRMGGGVAAGDYDNDGDVDLYLINGDKYPNVLLRNDGLGGFVDVAEAAGIGLGTYLGNGPAFVDLNGDGWLDLAVGGIQGSGMRLFQNKGDGTFSEQTGELLSIPIEDSQTDWSPAFGDPDGDGDLDMYVGHWGAIDYTNHFWINTGDGRFHAGDTYSEVSKAYPGEDWSFAPTFSDVNGDGRQDLLIASDFGTSRTLMNRDGLHFEDTTTDVIDDQNGMGSAIGDFDNDGDLDWFVTSIWFGDGTPKEGNRLYQNDGEGRFSNVTDTAGVIAGDWGWSACAADFNNDGWLDLFHVNGMFSDRDPIFDADLSRLFLNRGDGSFDEVASDVDLRDRKQGRGLVCFDYDLDGDIDIFTANVLQTSKLYRNDLDSNPGWLQVRLKGEPDNPSAVGAVIRVTTGELTQMREVRVGSNYLSQDPLMQHFGLGGAGSIDELRVSWPHGGETVLKDVEPNQRMELSAAGASPQPFTLVPGMSAAWFDRGHNGEGFLLEMLAAGRVVMYWFTYDKDGNQDWYIGVGKQKGRRVLFPELVQMSGGEFGNGFDPAKVIRTVVGTAAFTWTGCNEGFMDWTIGDELGRQKLGRLSNMAGLLCGPQQDPPVTLGEGMSGSWYDPSHNGEGYVLEVLQDGRALVFWFSYDTHGNRRWFYGTGGLEEDTWVFKDMLTTSGGLFGDDFDPATVEQSGWGSLELAIDCGGGQATYASTEEGFGEGSLQIKRLTMLDSLDCD